MKKNLTLLFFIFILVQVTSAQFPGGFGGGSGGSEPKIFDGRITGTVTEKASAKPIEFANIALYESGKDKPADGTVTDEKGTFKLKNIKNGKYKVTVTFIGFETITFDSL